MEDHEKPWWMAKDYPSNVFEGAPILWTIILVGYIAIAAVPALAMLSMPVACAIGASATWCDETVDG